MTWNPYSPGYFENPYPHLAACREHIPIHKGVHGFWLFFRYADVSRILRSADFDVSVLSEYLGKKEPYVFKGSEACPYLANGTRKWPMYLNGEQHKQVRAAMGKALTKIELTSVFEQALEATHEEFEAKQNFDLVSYCARYIFQITKLLFGIKDTATLESVKTYSNMLARSQDLFVPKQVYQEINSWLLWGQNLFDDSQYRASLESSFTQASASFSADDVYSVMALSVMAAFETSKDNLSVALYEVLKSAELTQFILECSAADLDLFIEESFRYTSPLQYRVRVSRNELAIENTVIAAGERLYLCIASANRDPAVFTNPEAIDPTRRTNEHLAFGGGLHFCLGASIARQEMRYCLKPMVKFLNAYRISDENVVKWGKQIFMRTLDSAMLEGNK